MLGIALGLASSVAWGISDFLGGLQSRRIPTILVLVVSQPVGFVLAVLVALLFGQQQLPLDQFALAFGAGAVGLLGLAAFYRAMAIGEISVVAMVTTLSVLVPIVGGVIQGEVPGVVQALGGGLAVVGVLMVAGGGHPVTEALHGSEAVANHRRKTRISTSLALLGALGFGTFFLAIDGAADIDAPWAIVAARAGGLTPLLLFVAWKRPSFGAVRDADMRALVAIGFFDITANTLFAFSTNHGLLPLVSVAASLYSLVTVMLARMVLAERLSRLQAGGIMVALAGVAVIAAGA